MKPQHRVLVLDDDEEILSMYSEMLRRLPSRPEVKTVNDGAKAIEILESEPFFLLLCDLKMPQMNGLEVLAIVKRKFPYLRTAVMTALVDEEFRAKSYALGVDLYLEKPRTAEEAQVFMNCVEALLDNEIDLTSFKTKEWILDDLFLLEALARATNILKISNGVHNGRVWFKNGEVIHATMGEISGSEALLVILEWKRGMVEIVTFQEEQKRSIFDSLQELLAMAAQRRAIRTAEVQQRIEQAIKSVDHAESLSSKAQSSGVEFAVVGKSDSDLPAEAWGIEKPEEMLALSKTFWSIGNQIGSALELGKPDMIVCLGQLEHFGVIGNDARLLCVGFNRLKNLNDIKKSLVNIFKTKI
jgi:CheY-like chemotaxis protein